MSQRTTNGSFQEYKDNKKLWGVAKVLLPLNIFTFCYVSTEKNQVLFAQDYLIS